MADHIKQLTGKVEAVYQTILAIAEDSNFQNIKLKAISRLISMCIIPIITYGGETWNPLKSEKKKLNQLLDEILKNMIKLLPTTPRECLYIETGLLDIETYVDKNRIMMEQRIKQSEQPNRRCHQQQHTRRMDGYNTKDKREIPHQ